MDEVVIRLVTTPASYPELIALWERAGLPYEAQGRDSPAAFARQLRLASHRCFVAEVDGKVVGSVLATHDGRKGWINRLAVDPDHQRRGIAQALVHAAEAALQAAGLPLVAALIETPNPPSSSLFRRLGYQERHDIVYYRKVFPG